MWLSIAAEAFRQPLAVATYRLDVFCFRKQAGSPNSVSFFEIEREIGNRFFRKRGVLFFRVFYSSREGTGSAGIYTRGLLSEGLSF